MKPMLLPIAVLMLGLLTGCAACRPQPHSPTAHMVEEPAPEPRWTDWLFEQVVNNALSWASWH